jgi:hypothetical protein
MSDLVVHPCGREQGFSPRHENWLRNAKVPVLVLNATTLNTGHCWQFTATWMGESPAAVEEGVDTAPRLRRMWYADAPPEHRDPPLARAVAASACVPGLFPPIRLANLFDGVDVRLVDGGVHDNQGIVSLLEQDCDVILVSDASGQSASRARPGWRVLGVARRSNNILMSRVRSAQFRDLTTRKRSGRLRGLMVVHLRKGLPAPPRDWQGCPEPYEAGAEGLETARPDYRIAEEAQRELAALRTDLDAFTEREAYGLMAAGYRMAETELAASLDQRLPASTRIAPKEPWPFAKALESIADKRGRGARAARREQP